MSSARTVTELVLRWDELRQQGRHIRPEEQTREIRRHLANSQVLLGYDTPKEAR